jgi:hypothetical protein
LSSCAVRCLLVLTDPVCVCDCVLQAVEGNCFSLVAPHATLDLEAQSPRDRAAWVFGIRTILRRKGIFVKEHQIPEDDDGRGRAAAAMLDKTDADDDVFKFYYQAQDETGEEKLVRPQERAPLHQHSD